ncbi:23S rRNA (adenine(2030)-N(6))-methyltransferase RlmJ [Massilia atriviolacea]|uniref:Ribosomal RNA large subunit methyltransferase J n=1 Tax=Massilia atriviolacea TaxID=2495579 RepID=A0A430HKJ7_9BURK|nr:23S rRNA (adenine(2030)-N(6))-methyltransferase RlmJ [Massilia atriviolacea]RSZ58034.1 23S rRNA (adenine(2030)-N(6))-methyltransferase RlmJ [Massilia atriviolacea]
MLSYRHAFHAGNHADVLKHFVQIQLLDYMNQKDTAYTYIDTHSGAGVYALDGGYASKNAEYETGIGPLWERKDLPKPLAEYVNLVKELNPSGKMRYYPGSPYCADKVMREHDRLRLFELHPADSKILADNFRKVEAHAAAQGERPSARGRRVLIERGDGFHALKTLLPPPSRRALVLIDPPYEDKQDYRKVRDALEDALVRFPSGIYAIWYPVLQRMESRQFADKLKRLAAKDWLNVTLTITTPGPDGFGLHSSGMFILNPPYTLEPTLRQIMPYLVQVLGKNADATYVLEKGTQVTGTASARTGANGALRMPVGNARKASPTSGTGSLRLPGQAPAGTPGAAGAPARAPGAKRSSIAAAAAGKSARPTEAGVTRKSARPAQGDTAGKSARPSGPRNSGPRRPS